MSTSIERTKSTLRVNKEEEAIFFKADSELLGHGEKLEEEEWTFEHAKLLYLIYKYARCSETASEKEGWIRQLSLLVLMFEGITSGTMDYDYAPASTLVTHNGRSKRVWLNITQEGKAAIDDLREKHLINGLKLSTEDFQPVTAYQVSHKGRAFISLIPKELTDEGWWSVWSGVQCSGVGWVEL